MGMRLIVLQICFQILLVEQTIAQVDSKKWQFSFSIDHVATENYYNQFVLYPTYEVTMEQVEKAGLLNASVSKLSPIGKRFALKYGVGYSEKGFFEKLTYIDFLNGETWEAENNIKLTYITIPVTLMYSKKFTKRAELYVDAGASADINTKASRSRFLNYNVNDIGFSGQFSFGALFKVTNGCSAVVGPIIRVPLMRYDNDPERPVDPVNLRPQSVGINFGLIF